MNIGESYSNSREYQEFLTKSKFSKGDGINYSKQQISFAKAGAKRRNRRKKK